MLREFLDDIIKQGRELLVEKFPGASKAYFMVNEPQLNARIARRILQKKKQLDAYRPLESFTVQRLHQDLRLLANYHSNAIEGNTLSLHETQMVLEYSITVDGHPLREYLEATNHGEAFDALPRLVERPITVETIQYVHSLVMDKIDPHAREAVQQYFREAGEQPRGRPRSHTRE